MKNNFRGQDRQDGLQRLEVREKRLADLIREIERGIADLDAGRVHQANVMFDELEARYA